MELGELGLGQFGLSDPNRSPCDGKLRRGHARDFLTPSVSGKFVVDSCGVLHKWGYP